MDATPTLESVIKKFAKGFHRRGPTDLNDKTITPLFANGLAREIRVHVTLKRKPDAPK